MKFDDKLYRELRCSGCRKLICYEYIFAGRIYYKCPRCEHENVFEFKHLRTGDNLKNIEEFEIKSNKVKNVKGGE